MTIDDVTTIDLTAGWAAELARLRRIEAAAREVLASGQAVYRGEIGGWGDAVHEADLVPAAKMTALRAAVDGEATS